MMLFPLTKELSKLVQVFRFYHFCNCFEEHVADGGGVYCVLRYTQHHSFIKPVKLVLCLMQ